MSPKVSETTMSKAEDLIDLAEKRFDYLTDDERNFLQKITVCGDTTGNTDDNLSNDSACATEQQEKPTLSAFLIAWLCTDSEACSFISYQGIRIKKAKIEGSLNLQSANIDFPLVFLGCEFTEAIRLEYATIKLLNLSGCCLQASQTFHDTTQTWRSSSLEARGLQVQNDVLLCAGFKATGKVSLLSATVGGYLDCSGGTFKNPEGDALTAEGAQINGAVLLRKGFKATGTVSLLGATVGGNLNCSGGTFDQHKGIAAINASSAEIRGFVLLCAGFKATGIVSLVGATVGGNLDCSGGTFKNPEGYALIAQGTEIKGAVFLGNGFKATGTVSLLGAMIGGNLECDDGTLENHEGYHEGYALIAQGTEIKGAVLLRNRFKATGTVSLLGATVGGNLDCNRGTFDQHKGIAALDALGAQIKGNVLLGNGFKATGTVSLFGALISGGVVCSKGTFDQHKGIAAINASSAEIKGNVFFGNEFKATGIVSLVGATVGGNLNCSGGTFNNLEGVVDVEYKSYLLAIIKLLNSNYLRLFSFYFHTLIKQRYLKYCALNAYSAKINGSVFLGRGFRGIGEVSFCDAMIQDRIQIKGLQELDHIVLTLEFATVGTLEDSEESWPSAKKLYLNGFSYEKISHNSPMTSEQRLKWIRQQDQETTFSPQPYEQLARVLQASGHEQDATKVLIAKEEDRRKYGKLGACNCCWNWLLGLFIAHGYQPQRALCFSLILIISGTILFSVGHSFSLITPSRVETFESTPPSTLKPVSENYPKFNPFVYSLDVFLPIINLHQQNYWLPNPNKGIEIPLVLLKTGTLLRWYFWFHIVLKTGTLLRWYFWFHIVAGWCLTSLWVAGFTGLVRRVK